MTVGINTSLTTLCIGLDIAWFGGSASNKASQFDFLASTLVSDNNPNHNFRYERVALKDRDPTARILCDSLTALIDSYQGDYDRVVFAVDAPLQAMHRPNLPTRKPLSARGTLNRRACEETLSKNRVAIDKLLGGAQGWQPNVQPGAPLAPRVVSLLAQLTDAFDVWTPENTASDSLMIECFPAEAIWAAKRQNWYSNNTTSIEAKIYKKQQGNQLSQQEVIELVTSTLYPFRYIHSNFDWQKLVDTMLAEILRDPAWKKEDYYPGGKMLDDVVDSMLCLATAVSYAAGNAHVWFDKNAPEDGHIIGPGSTIQRQCALALE